MGHFAMPVMGRDQLVLIPTTLDDSISDDHEVRILDDILRLLDWSDWEDEYCLVRGQPPIHPRIKAAVILYGLMRRIRSSRVLEYHLRNNIDFMWLAEGRTIDHSTLSTFRKRFKKQLKMLFQSVGRFAMNIGLVRLGEVTFDGTRVKANNDRYETLNLSDIDDQLAKLTEQFGKELEIADQVDEAEDQRFGLSSPLPADLADAKTRFKRLQEAQAKLQEAEAARRRKDPKHAASHPAQLPSTDPDSKVLPNKEGGSAPNYTPLIAVDVHSDFIVSIDVIAETDENAYLLDMVDDVKDVFGKSPGAVLADALHATGPNIAGMEERGVEFLSPPPREESGTNPALRNDPSQPVPEVNWPNLPRNPQTKKLDKVCFIYDAENDLFYCPMGKLVKYEEKKSEMRQGQIVPQRIYRCPDCKGCPLYSDCVTDKNQRGRTIRRDVYTAQREKHAAKMQKQDAKDRYKLRFHAGESPFGWLKHVLGLRQFLLRDLENVRVEWTWACTAYNLKKCLAHVGRVRALIYETLISAEN